MEDAVTKPKVTAQPNIENYKILSPNRFAPLQPNKENFGNNENRNNNIDFDREIMNNSYINRNINSERRPPSTVVNLHPERQTTFQKLRPVPGEDCYSQAVKKNPHKLKIQKKKKIVIT